MLALSPSLRHVFTAPEVEDLLVAVHSEHAPDLVPTNCRPRVLQLLALLKAADAEAASQNGSASSSPRATSSAEVAEDINAPA
jgi:hypothetical protein